MAMTAEPEPKMGANKVLPIRTRRRVTGLYEINAFLSGSMWSVAPVSATMRLVCARPCFAGATKVEWAGGLSRQKCKYELGEVNSSEGLIIHVRGCTAAA